MFGVINGRRQGRQSLQLASDKMPSHAQHYGRFLPQDKASLAAKVLNKVWA